MADNIKRVGGPITLEEGAEWTANYRDKNPKATQGYLYGEEIIRQIIKQDDCEGIRFYNGIDRNGESLLVLVGVDTEGNDLVDGIVADLHKPCPPSCGTKNALNSSE